MNEAVVSVSGGMDSTGLLLRLLSEGRDVNCISFYYGQKHSVELERLKKNIEYLASKGIIVQYNSADLSSVMGLYHSALTEKDYVVPEGHYADENMKQTVVPNRNAIFSSLVYGYALSIATERQVNVDIALGVHSGDHCFTRDTKILTPKGLKTVDTLKIGESVYSFNEESRVWEEDTLVDIIKKNVVEKVNIITTQAGELELTDEHEVYRLKLGEFDNTFGFSKSIEKVKVSDLEEGDYLVQPTSIFNKDVPANLNLFETVQKILQKYENAPELVREGGKIGLCTRSKKGDAGFIAEDIDLKDLVSILAWYIAEGWSDEEPYNLRENGDSRFCATFCQSIKANLEKVEYTIERLKTSSIPVKYEFSKLKHNNYPKEINFYFSNIVSLLMKECGSHSYVEHIPSWLWEILVSSLELREEFIRSITLGDGFNYNEQVKGFCSTSPVLMEQMITLLQLSGYHYSLTKSKTTTKYITFSKKGTKQALLSLGDAKFTKILYIGEKDYNDNVFDLSVKNNHNFAAGNFGQHLISNSIYPDCRPEFYDAIYKAFTIGNWESEKVSYYLPYMEKDKYFILKDAQESCIKLGLDFNTVFANTNTCYAPNAAGESCGKCGSCTERLEAFEKLGIKDPVKYSSF